ncbi:MAG TPA: TonB-dependent receptor, partial [Terracidiphilus sp.]
GLFLGDDASNAISETSGHLPDSQDQRNTFAGRAKYEINDRIWLAAGVFYGSGLPFEFGGTLPEALAQYGPAVISHLNFDRGRVHPQISANASAGIDLFRRDTSTVTLQIDGENLNNHLNVIDFGGLFSGNAIGPGRSVFARLTAAF